jgi:hypothetical protein
VRSAIRFANTSFRQTFFTTHETSNLIVLGSLGCRDRRGFEHWWIGFWLFSEERLGFGDNPLHARASFYRSIWCEDFEDTLLSLHKLFPLPRVKHVCLA